MEENASTGTMMFGVLDGHGEAGDLVSQYFRDRFPQMVFEHASFPGQPNTAMTECFEVLEKGVLKDTSIDTEFSGSTAVLSTITGNVLHCANIGDSRLILGSLSENGELVPIEVSDDHKPERPDEKARILAKGGRVFAVEYDDGVDGPARVWLAHMDIPGLAMSRSLGDTVAHSAGVISDPECFERVLTPNDKFLVIASDGLWEFMSNEEVVGIVSGYDDPKRAVDHLVREATQRWMREEQVVDDTTVAVAFLNVQ